MCIVGPIHCKECGTKSQYVDEEVYIICSCSNRGNTSTRWLCIIQNLAVTPWWPSIITFRYSFLVFLVASHEVIVGIKSFMFSICLIACKVAINSLGIDPDFSRYSQKYRMLNAVAIEGATTYTTSNERCVYILYI